MEAVLRKDIDVKKDNVIIKTELLELFNGKVGDEEGMFMFVPVMNDIVSYLISVLTGQGIRFITKSDNEDEGEGQGKDEDEGEGQGKDEDGDEDGSERKNLLIKVDGIKSIVKLSDIIKMKKGVLSYNMVERLFITLPYSLYNVMSAWYSGESYVGDFKFVLDNVVFVNGKIFLYMGNRDDGAVGGAVGGAAAGASGGSDFDGITFSTSPEKDDLQMKWPHSLSLLCGYCLTGNNAFVGDGMDVDGLKDERGRKSSTRVGIAVALQMIEDTRLYFNLVRAYKMGVYMLT